MDGRFATDFDEYLTVRGLVDEDFAERMRAVAGEHPEWGEPPGRAAVNRWRNGRRRPTASSLKFARAASDGELTANSFEPRYHDEACDDE